MCTNPDLLETPNHYSTKKILWPLPQKERFLKHFKGWLRLSMNGSNGLSCSLFLLHNSSLCRYSHCNIASSLSFLSHTKLSNNVLTLLCPFPIPLFVCWFPSMRIAKHSESQWGSPRFSFSDICKNWTTFFCLEEKMTNKKCFLQKRLNFAP